MPNAGSGNVSEPLSRPHGPQLSRDLSFTANSVLATLQAAAGASVPGNTATPSCTALHTAPGTTLPPSTQPVRSPSLPQPQYRSATGSTQAMAVASTPSIVPPISTVTHPQLSRRPSPSLQGHPRKPPIMDPPSNGSFSNGDPDVADSSGFPSPDIDHGRSNHKFNEDAQRINFAVQQSVPEAVRHSVRANWTKCLMGSDFHQAFILNASVHHASASAVRRMLKSFGRKMVGQARNEMASHFSSDDLDAVASVLLEKMSPEFLDKALALRLQTIEARPLINALAAAGRLGYDPDDIVQHCGETQAERVIPSTEHAIPRAEPATPSAPSPASRMPLLSRERGQWNCPLCARNFRAQSAYEYHVDKGVCRRAPPNINGFSFSCPHCGQGFLTAVGLSYHNTNLVCGDFGQGPKTPKPVYVRQSPRMESPAAPTSTPRPQIPASAPSTRPIIAHDHPRSMPSTPALSHDALHVSRSSEPKYVSSYELLAPDIRNAMLHELKEAETKYKGLMKDAEKIADPGSRLTRLENLKNSYSTKQSMIRKKYGVRLRDRRGKAQMEDDRQRLGIMTASMLGNSAIEKATMELRNRGSGTPAVAPDTPVPQPPEARRVSGWTAANSGAGDESQPAAKRRRTEHGADSRSYTSPYGNLDEPPSKRRGLTVSEITGSSTNSSAMAARADSTLSMNEDPAGAKATQAQRRTMASLKGQGFRVAISASAPSTRASSNSNAGVSERIANAPIKITDDSGSDEKESSGDDDIPNVPRA